MALTKISRGLLSTGISDSSDATAITIDSSENVGIGTASPAHLLELVRSSTDFGATLEINNTSSANGSVSAVRYVTENETTGLMIGKHSNGFTSGADLAFINQELNSDLTISTNNTERMRIQSGGNVLLNQTATADSGVSDARLEITRSSQHCINCHVAGTGNSTLVAFINDNGFVGGINTNGSATAFNTSSDARLKNILGEAKGLEVVNALNPVNFEWKSDGKIQDGLIAQEVEEVFPQAVSEPELDGEWYSVDYSRLVTPLIKAIQEQQTQIEALQSEINTLKGGD